jgi:hypothetical protein
MFSIEHHNEGACEEKEGILRIRFWGKRSGFGEMEGKRS